MLVSLVTWWLALQVLGIMALPLTACLFGHLSLKGYAFSKTLGLLLAGYGVWLLAMFRLVRFDAGGIILAGLMGLAAGLWILRRSGWSELLTTIRSQWPVVLAYEVVFAGTLLGGLWLHGHGAVGTAITGTEKPMELAFLSGILHSPTFPPQDPWLAGYAINYYYLGYVLLAVLAALSGVSAGEAFTLGLATILALTALMTVGLIVALIEQSGAQIRSRGRAVGTGAVALLGLIFVLILGNQAGALQVFLGTPEVVALDGPQLFSVGAQRLRGEPILNVYPAIQTSEYDFGRITALTPRPGAPFDWWWPSRAVWDDGTVQPDEIKRGYAITEFPFFSFYLGDLHPHVLALPFGLLALTLALAVLIQPLSSISLSHVRGWLLIGVSGLVLGSLYMINSWEMPAYVLVYAGAFVLGYRRQSPHLNLIRSLGQALCPLAAVCLAAGVILIPFLVTFQSFAGGIPAPAPWSDIPLLRSLGQILLPAPAHTGLAEFITIFGLFGLILVAYVTSSRSTGAETSAFWSVFDKYPWAWLVGTFVIGLWFKLPLLALLPLAWLSWRVAWQSTAGEQPAQTFVGWVTAVGALVIFAADAVYLRDPFENRMNTVFKLYFQVWVIWGLGAAYGVWLLAQQARQRPFFTLAWGLPALLLALGALVYPVATLRWGQPWRTGAFTLDGLAFLQESSPDETAALDWIKHHTGPGDVVLTAVGSSYDASTGWVAAVTGRPTLLGWSDSHERLWRRGSPAVLAEIAAREQDIPLIYTTTDRATAQRLLNHYQVQYIFIGSAERRLYAGPGLDKFGSWFELVFQQGDIRLYRCL